MADDKVFIPHITECWAPATRLNKDTYKLLDSCDNDTTDDLKQVTFDAALWKKITSLPTLTSLPPFEQCKTCFSPIVDVLEGSNNIAELQSVTEGSVLHAIRARYKKKVVYTNVGRIVIALNPFEQRPELYSCTVIQNYAQAQAPYSLAPHVYQVAAGAYKGLSEDGRNQSTLITGESGAGKTESTKLLLRFFASLGKSHGGVPETSAAHGAKATVEDRIIMANPILEAFGNASTSRNHNSSRFGKWIEVLFDPGMHIKGATITSYMLEMPRVCEHLHCDRTYHVFYHVVGQHLSAAQRNKTQFKYLIPTKTPDGVKVRGHNQKVNDEAMYKELVQALKDYEFTSNEQTGIFNLVACVLYLGNLVFDAASIKGGEGSSISLSTEDDLNNAVSLLGVDVSVMRNCLTTKTVSAGKETMELSLKPSEASAARDGLSKLIYGSLFNWLIHRINEELHSQSNATLHSIGVLDIAGFERFDINSYEQLLINLSNEKLQQHFNRDIIMAELEDYKKEGIMELKLNFNDNACILSLIEGRAGIMDVLDEELFVPKGTDEGFTKKVIKAHGQTPHLIAPKFTSGAPSFGVSHFAGCVTYTVSGWLDKNRLSPPREAYHVLSNAHNNVVKQMVKLIITDTKKMTVSGQFRKQLHELVSKIQATQTHYIRCIKPNALHAPCGVESHELLRQLKCAGIMEAIKIRKSGYSFRPTFQAFAERYSILIGVGKPSDKTTCEQIISAAKSKVSFNEQDICIAQTKVMMREAVRLTLDKLRIDAIEGLKKPLMEFIDAYEKACQTQNGMFLWPTSLLGKDIDTPAALGNKLKALNAGLDEVKNKLGTMDNPPSWVGTAILARDAIQKEMEVVMGGQTAFNKVKPLSCDPFLVKELKDIAKIAKEQGLKNEIFDKINQILNLIIEEEDWEGQLKAGDTDLDSLLKEIKQRNILTPSCQKCVKEAQVRLEIQKKAKKKDGDKKCATTLNENNDELCSGSNEEAKSQLLGDDILSQIKPKMPPGKVNYAAMSEKTRIAKSISKRAVPSIKAKTSVYRKE